MFDNQIIEKFKSIETPFYYYHTDLLHRTLSKVKELADKYRFHVHYALKANSNDQILKIISGYGLGADCVSGNEVLKALSTGFDASHVVFAGVGKSDKEIINALEKDIFCFNCESIQEIQVINELASKMNKIASIAIRINPNVEANTHKYIATGKEENKFGINMAELNEILEIIKHCGYIKLIGIHFHIGSQIRDLDNFKNLCFRVNEIQEWFTAQNIRLTEINVGGGLGINYQEPDREAIPDFDNYFSIFNQYLKVKPSQRVHFELGRSIVAQCGSLISKVLYVKKGSNKQFAILDAGMNVLIRPALYQAYHKIENITATSSETAIYDVVGPICESADFFGKEVSLPITQRGDLIAVRSAGAYGEVMMSLYNLKEQAQSVFE
jgi:diaminopimelate decarboxylase